MSGEVSKAVHWAGEHPVPVAIGVVVAGLVVMFLMRGGSSSSGNQAAANAAFYGATAASTQAGEAVQLAQINADAATAQTKIAADATTQKALALIGMQTQANLQNYNLASSADTHAFLENENQTYYNAATAKDLAQITASSQLEQELITHGGGSFQTGGTGFVYSGSFQPV